MQAVLLSLQAAVAILAAIVSNPQATLSQKQQAMAFSVSASQLFTKYMQSISITTVTPIKVESMPPLSAPLITPQTGTGGPGLAVEDVVVPKPTLTVGTTTAGMMLDKAYPLSSDSKLTIDRLVVSVFDHSQGELIYPSGIPIRDTKVGVVHRFRVQECFAVKPDYACPAKNIATADDYKTTTEFGYIDIKDPFTIEANTQYYLDVPESGRLVYIHAVDVNGNTVEQTF